MTTIFKNIHSVKFYRIDDKLLSCKIRFVDGTEKAYKAGKTPKAAYKVQEHSVMDNTAELLYMDETDVDGLYTIVIYYTGNQFIELPPVCFDDEQAVVDDATDTLAENSENEPQLHLSYGNSKIGKIPNFNLTPGTSCSRDACSTCHIGRTQSGKKCNQCYACKSYRLYKTVRHNWDENTELVLTDCERFKRTMIRIINNWKRTKAAARAGYRFRIHAAGDFISKEYMLSWYEIIRVNPEVNFLAFTKQYTFASDLQFCKPDNLSLIVSGGYELENTIPESMQSAPIAFIAEHENTLPELETRKQNATVCPGSCVNCAACWNCHKLGNDIVFHQH